MKRRVPKIAVFGLLIVAAGCSNGGTGNKESEATSLKGRVRVFPETGSQVPGETELELGDVIFLPRAGADSTQVRNAIAAKGLEFGSKTQKGPYILARLPNIKKVWRAQHRAATHAEGMTEADKTVLKEAWLRYRSDTERTVHEFEPMTHLFQHVVPNYTRKISACDTDPSADQWAIEALSLKNVWQEFPPDRMTPVTVAVIDSGIWPEHPNLKNNLVLPGFDFVSDEELELDETKGPDNDAREPADARSTFHGTHVAGIIAGYTSTTPVCAFNGVGGEGGRIKILPIRALGADGVGSDFDIAQAILYSAGLETAYTPAVEKPRAEVINLSLGGAGESPILADAIGRASRRGMVVVAAAGNEREGKPSYPASYAEVLGVGALAPDDQFADEYSNYGANVDLVAPGGGWPPTDDQNGDERSDGILSTWVDYRIPDPTFAPMSGTSMASPYIAGAVAYILSIQPGLTPGQVRSLLYKNAIEVCDRKFCGRGKIDLSASLGNAQSTSRSKSSVTTNDDPVVLSAKESKFQFVVANQGEEKVQVVDIQTTPFDQTWLEIAPGQDEKGLTFDLTAKTDGLAKGFYHVEIAVVTDASVIVMKESGGVQSEDGSGLIRKQVYLDLGGDSRQPSAVYVVLTDTSGDRRPVATATATKDNNYEFHFGEQKAGDYFLFAGEDRNDNKIICEAGELCGAYKSIDHPEVLRVGTETLLRDLMVAPDFSAKHLIRLSGG